MRTRGVELLTTSPANTRITAATRGPSITRTMLLTARSLEVEQTATLTPASIASPARGSAGDNTRGSARPRSPRLQADGNGGVLVLVVCECGSGTGGGRVASATAGWCWVEACGCHPVRGGSAPLAIGRPTDPTPHARPAQAEAVAGRGAGERGHCHAPMRRFTPGRSGSLPVSMSSLKICTNHGAKGGNQGTTMQPLPHVPGNHDAPLPPCSHHLTGHSARAAKSPHAPTTQLPGIHYVKPTQAPGAAWKRVGARLADTEERSA